MNDFELECQQAQAQLAEACATVGMRSEDSEDELDPELIPFVMVERAIWEESVEATERLRRLQKTNSVSQSDFDKQLALSRVAKAKYESALRTVEEKVAQIRSRRVALAQANQNKQDATVRAPFDGVVRVRHLASGDVPTTGSAGDDGRPPLIRFAFVDGFRNANPPMSRLGRRSRFTLRARPSRFKARLLASVQRLDLASRSLLVEADVENPRQRYRSGLFAEGLVAVDPDATTLALPSSAIGEFAGVYKVWMVHGDTIAAQRITIGRQRGARTEVDSGLVGRRTCA